MRKNKGRVPSHQIFEIILEWRHFLKIKMLHLTEFFNDFEESGGAEFSFFFKFSISPKSKNGGIFKFIQKFGEMERHRLFFSKNYTKFEKKIIRNFY